MASVIVNDEGELYGGFDPQSSRPVWFKTKRDGCILDDEIARRALSQLHQLGYTKTVIRDAHGVLRKWVPADLDASAA